MAEDDKCAIIHEWFEIILPMTADGEKTVQDKAMTEINLQECFHRDAIVIKSEKYLHLVR